MADTEKFRMSYKFFSEMEKTKTGFNLDDIAKATGWSKNTVRTYISKKWDKLIKRLDLQYFVVG